MNLKTAARKLGVHYQTVYRLVRTGELPATKIGVSYDVSDAALDVFRSRQARLASGARTAPEIESPIVASGVDVSDAFARDLDRLVTDCPSTVQPLLIRAAQGLAEDTGSCCVICLLGDDGHTLRAVAWWHPSVHALAVWSRLFTAFPMTAEQLPGGGLPDTTHAVDHLSQVWVHRTVPSESRYLLDTLAAHGLLLATIRHGDDAPLGVLGIIRDQPGRVFSEHEHDVCRHVADIVGAAIVRADEFDAAVSLRRRAIKDLTAALAVPMSDEALQREVTRIVHRVGGSVALVDEQGLVVAASPEFARRLGCRVDDLVGHPYPSTTSFGMAAVDGDDRTAARLWLGEIDHVSVTRPCRQLDGDVVVDAHWSVVRWPDATPAFLLTVQSPVPAAPRPPVLDDARLG